MNWDRIEGNWKQIKGSVMEQWGRLADDNFDVIAGKRENFAGRVQETHGTSSDAMEKHFSAWQQRIRDLHHAD